MQQAPREQKNGPSDQAIKQRVVLVTALLSLVGFVLEVGPVGSAFQPAWIGFAIELRGLGFLPYLALAAAAAVGLHFSETEPRPKEPPPESGPVPAVSNGAVGERVAVRPELHQFRMFLTALGGYVVLKGIAFAFMWPYASQNYLVDAGTLLEAFRFGFLFMALSWFVLWQFLRWIAIRQRWIRLQEELVGGDVVRMIAVIIVLEPIYYLVKAVLLGELSALPQIILALLLHLMLVPVAYFLWTARPVNLRRTVIGLLSTGGVIAVLTVILVIVERFYGV
ncbi:MAG: hypothetical protein ACYC7E_18805 [Armatimonadota bacterium]